MDDRYTGYIRSPGPYASRICIYNSYLSLQRLVKRHCTRRHNNLSPTIKERTLTTCLAKQLMIITAPPPGEQSLHGYLHDSACIREREISGTPHTVANNLPRRRCVSLGRSKRQVRHMRATLLTFPSSRSYYPISAVHQAAESWNQF